MGRQEYLEKQAEVRARPEAAAMSPFVPGPATAELEALASELQLENPRLSLDQALDAATIELLELEGFTDGWEDWRVREWAQRMVYAKQWDRDAAALAAHTGV